MESEEMLQRSSIPPAESYTDSSANRPAETLQIHPQIPPTRRISDGL
jgi:hypothetical protein